MKKHQHNFLALCGVIVLIFALIFVIKNRQINEGGETSLTAKRAVVGGVSFLYPAAYGEMMKSESNAQPGQPNIVIFENTDSAKAFFSNTATVPGEAPPTITLHVYQKTSTEDTDTFLRKASPYIFSKGAGRPIVLNNKEALSYTWDGLYKGDSVAFTRGDTVYLFSVTYITTNDPIVKAYENIVNQLEFQ
ncbi:MAG: hypothetical protein RI935_449 [Candidatus Parcubacteria bacterium]|jgi:hypothetical protein